MTNYSTTELHSRTDPLLLPWLDLYESAFPPVERIPVSNFLRILQEQEQGGGEKHLLAVRNERGELAGLAALYAPRNWRAAHLWYFAIQPQLRSQGLGSLIYQQILVRLQHPPGQRHSEWRALVYDVEDPQEMHTSETRTLATRRIQFYQRNGARLLTGARVIFEPAPGQIIHLRLMIHALAHVHAREELTAQAAFDLAGWLYGDTLEQVGELAWESL